MISNLDSKKLLFRLEEPVKTWGANIGEADSTAFQSNLSNRSNLSQYSHNSFGHNSFASFGRCEWVGANGSLGRRGEVLGRWK